MTREEKGSVRVGSLYERPRLPEFLTGVAEAVADEEVEVDPEEVELVG